jgi:hypothetical protein
VLLALWTVPAAEATDPERCATLATAAERIVCYDRQFPPESPTPPVAEAPSVVDPVADAPPSHQPVLDAAAVDAAPIDAAPREVATSAEGERTPPATSQSWTRRLFDWPARVQEQSTIKAIRLREGQNMAFLLANDQIWLQDSQRALPFRVGDAVTVENGTFGGYFLTSDRGTKTRVRRIK